MKTDTFEDIIYIADSSSSGQVSKPKEVRKKEGETSTDIIADVTISYFRHRKKQGTQGTFQYEGEITITPKQVAVKYKSSPVKLTTNNGMVLGLYTDKSCKTLVTVFEEGDNYTAKLDTGIGIILLTGNNRELNELHEIITEARILNVTPSPTGEGERDSDLSLRDPVILHVRRGRAAASAGGSAPSPEAMNKQLFREYLYDRKGRRMFELSLSRYHILELKVTGGEEGDETYRLFPIDGEYTVTETDKLGSGNYMIASRRGGHSVGFNNNTLIITGEKRMEGRGPARETLTILCKGEEIEDTKILADLIKNTKILADLIKNNVNGYIAMKEKQEVRRKGLLKIEESRNEPDHL